MSELNIQLCPETGICSIIKPDGKKVDLMPGEVGELKDAAGDVGAVKQAIAQVDDGFAEGLGAEEIAQLVKKLG